MTSRKKDLKIPFAATIAVLMATVAVFVLFSGAWGAAAAEGTVLKTAKFDGTAFTEITAAPTDMQYTYFSGHVESGQAVKASDAAYIFNGSVLVNDDTDKMALVYEVPAAGTYYVKDMVQTDPLGWADPLPERTVKALFKIVKESGGALTDVYPLEGGNNGGYAELKSEYSDPGSCIVDISVEAAAGDKLYFLSGLENSTLYAAPRISTTPFIKSYELRDSWRANQYLDRTYFDVVYLDNTGETTVASPLMHLDPFKTEWHIDNRQDIQPYMWDYVPLYMGAFGGFWLHSGINAGEDIAYRFTAPEAGTASIMLETLTASWVPEIAIYHNSAKIWPTDAAGTAVLDLGTVTLNNAAELAAGDILDFVLLGKGGGSLKTYLNPIITLDAELPELDIKNSLILENGGNVEVAATVSGGSASDLTWSVKQGDEAKISVASDEQNPLKATVTALESESAMTASVVASFKGIVKEITVTVHAPIAKDAETSEVYDLTEGDYAVLYSGTVYVTAAITEGGSLSVKRGAVELAGTSVEGVFVSLTFTVSKGETLTVTAAGAQSLKLKYTDILKVEDDKIYFDKTELLLKSGDTATLGYSITPAASADKPVTFTSSDDKIVTVSAAGKITAVARGKAVITVTVNDSVEGGSPVSASTEVYVVGEGSVTFDSIVNFDIDGSPFWDYEYINHPSVDEPEPAFKALAWHSGGPFDMQTKDGSTISAHQFVLGSTEYVGELHQYLCIAGGFILHPGNGADVSLTFVAPYDGVVNIYDVIGVMHANSDGVNIVVEHYNSAGKTKLWPAAGDSFLQGHSESVMVIDNITVKSGDKIRFIVNKYDTLSNDSAYLDPTIYYSSVDLDSMNLSVVLDKTSLSLTAGRTAVLSASLSVDIGTVIPFVFSSLDNSIAEVDEFGIIKAKKEGTVKIKVSWIDEALGMTEALTAECSVTVTPVADTEKPNDNDEKGCKSAIGGTAPFVAAVLASLVLALSLRKRMED